VRRSRRDDSQFVIVALIGPSAAGKSSVARRLVAAGDVRVVPTYTTRPPRADERTGCIDHRFCDETDFDALVTTGALAATGRLRGLAYRYGLPTLDRRATRPLLVMARASHVDALHELGHRTVVYQLRADATRCQQRLTARSTDAADVDARARAHAADLVAGTHLANRVFRNNGTLDDLAEAIAAALYDDRKD
jgi:guanylate kinase